MKKIITLLLIITTTFALLHTEVKASDPSDYGVPYQTYTLDSLKRRIPTQTAYIPVGVLGQDFGFTQPQDLFYKDQEFYVADTGMENALYRIRVLANCDNFSGNLEEGSYDVVIVPPDGGTCLDGGTKITSLGEYRDSKKRIEVSY